MKLNFLSLKCEMLFYLQLVVRQNGQEGSMVSCNSRLSLFFLHGFLGEEGREISYFSLFNQVRGGRDLHSKGREPHKFPLLVLPLLSPVTDVYRKEISLPQLREPEKVQSYRPVIACFPPR